MLYEPIGYIYEYEIGALAVFFVIMMRYFTARRFPNQKNRLYALIMWATVLDVALDVGSSLIIDNVAAAPLAVVYLVNTSFYAMTVLMLVLMMIYTMALTGHMDSERLKNLFPLFLPALTVLIMLGCNPVTRLFFYVDEGQAYVHGQLFIFIYVVSFIYMVFTLIFALRNRKIMRKEEYTTIFVFLAVVMVSVVIQYFCPALLATGVAIMLSVVLMYFTIQNPEAMVDSTTGSFTYDAMLTFLRDRMREKDRVQLIAVKVRNMSRINDLLGIDNGSLLLRSLSLFLSERVDDSWVFRMRGSCFVAITRQKADYDSLRRQLSSRIAQPWIVNGTEVLLQAVVCCVETEGLLSGPISPEEAVSFVETAFAQSERGVGRIVELTVGKELLDRVKRNSQVEAALREALDSGEGLELYFQPMWSIKRERFVSAEVLLRFNHPVLGFIPADEFVAIAESNGLITSLDEFVVRKTCQIMQKYDYFRFLGLESLEINLSALEFMHRRLPELLRDIMTQYGVDPSLLCFEVTETAATESFELLQECMTDISRFGCSFALDDFGTGYANISQVIQLPFSIVKLDKSMLYGPGAVLEDLARMFARIDRQTVIEGVEKAEQAETVKSYGLDIIQGFYYARPMDETSFIKFLRGRL